MARRFSPMSEQALPGQSLDATLRGACQQVARHLGGVSGGDGDSRSSEAFPASRTTASLSCLELLDLVLLLAREILFSLGQIIWKQGQKGLKCETCGRFFLTL